jgi:3',5'-nucleoside bisphosphate phosphatase
VRVELHCHSTFSDGSEAPAAVAARAAAREVELFCLTDHDSCKGTEATRAALPGRRVLRGVELSCVEHKRTVHVLLYDVAGDERWAVVEEALTQQAAARRHRLRNIAARLERLNVRIDVEAILAGAGERTVGRPDIARAVVAAGGASSMQEAFTRYLHDGGPADEPVARLSVADGLALAAQAGARASLAHPHILGELARPLIRKHKSAGLTGIEAFYGVYREADRRDWCEFAEREGLVCTAGSDFHGTGLPEITDVGVDLPQPWADKLMAWLAP